MIDHVIYRQVVLTFTLSESLKLSVILNLHHNLRTSDLTTRSNRLVLPSRGVRNFNWPVKQRKWCFKQLPQDAFLEVTTLNFGHCRPQREETARTSLLAVDLTKNNKTTANGANEDFNCPFNNSSKFSRDIKTKSLLVQFSALPYRWTRVSSEMTSAN